MYSFSPTSGERFYNMIDRDDWIKKKRFTITEQQAPSVTTVLSTWPKSEAYAAWLASKGSLDEALKERDAGGARGTRVHQNIERITKGEVLNFHEYKKEHFKGNDMLAYPEWRRLESFTKWHADMGYPKIINRRNGQPALECTLYSWEDLYAGTTDIIVTGGFFGSLKVMVDFKTGKGIYLSFWAQLCAYFKAWHEMKEEKLDAVGVLLFGGQSRRGYKFEMVSDMTQIEGWYLDFLAAYRIWNRENQKSTLSSDHRTWTDVRSAREVYEVEEIICLEQPMIDRNDMPDDDEETPAWAMRPGPERIVRVLSPVADIEPALNPDLPAGEYTSTLVPERMFQVPNDDWVESSAPTVLPKKKKKTAKIIIP